VTAAGRSAPLGPGATIGGPGATIGGLAAAIVALHDPAIAARLDAYRAQQTARVLGETLP